MHYKKKKQKTNENIYCEMLFRCVSLPNDLRECNSEEIDQAYDQCYTLLGEAFRACHEAVHPETYITSCVTDYCATNGNHITLCEAFKSYAAACAVAGVELREWQAGTVCGESLRNICFTVLGGLYQHVNIILVSIQGNVKPNTLLK